MDYKHDHKEMNNHNFLDKSFWLGLGGGLIKYFWDDPFKVLAYKAPTLLLINHIFDSAVVAGACALAGKVVGWGWDKRIEFWNYIKTKLKTKP